MWWPLLVSVRPRQWTKNLIVYVGLIFALRLTELPLLVRATWAFVAFCALSSAIYLLNDVLDRERDRQHPLKCRRPIAMGKLRPPPALAAALLLALLGIVVAGALGGGFLALAAAYIGVMLVYNVWLKRVVLLDVFAIAAGFVLRAAAGAVAVGVPISPWLYVCTTLGALFIGFGKRRHELTLLADEAEEHRSVLREYTPAFLDVLIAVVSGSAVVAYSLYTFSAENLPRNHAMMLTIPFLLYGTFRYLYLIHLRDAGGSPEEILLRDRPLLANIALWLVVAVLILYVAPR
ncbi:MAG: decaprenyl-phosphate phosphoribosyltransferase [Chloroflexi bacterium]|nr:decaprenyl-phosphate phosphoribosyltransferase [Chloroflexota bacterium]